MKTITQISLTVMTAIILLSAVSCKKTENTAETKTENKNGSPYLDESIVKIIKDSLIEDGDVEETKDSLIVSYKEEDIPGSYSEFSKRKKENVFGDLDGDGKEEAVVTVHTDGGTAHLQFYSIYIFTQKNNKWELLLVTDNVFKDVSEDLCGQLQPYKIENGLLKAFMDCHFVASYDYDVTLKLENKRLVVVKAEIDKSEQTDE